MRRRGHHQGQTGLTWLELLVALAVLGVAVAVAIPGYRGYVLRMNRGDAARDLRTVATQLQRCFARTGDYRLEASGTRDACVQLPQTNPEGTYTLSFEGGAPTASTYRLVATPINAQAADVQCGQLVLDEAGREQVSGGTLPADQCWQKPGE